MKAKLRFDASELDFHRLLAAADRFPEISDRLVHLVESGDQLVCFNTDLLPATGADEVTMVVRPDPTDGLRVLLAAARARDTELSVLEHAQPPQVASKR